MAKDYQELYAVVDDIETKAYTRGYNDGKKMTYEEVDKAYKRGYEIGAEEAWKTAQNVIKMPKGEKYEWYGIVDPILGFEAKEAMESWNRYQTSKLNRIESDEEVEWYDIPAEEMNKKQLIAAVKELRQFCASLRWRKKE